MGYQIHCRKRRGKEVYRLFSSYSDIYLTPELSEKQILEAYLVHKIAHTVAEVVEFSEPLIVRPARESSERDTEGDLSAPWDNEIREHRKEYRGEMVRTAEDSVSFGPTVYGETVVRIDLRRESDRTAISVTIESAKRRRSRQPKKRR